MKATTAPKLATLSTIALTLTLGMTGCGGGGTTVGNFTVSTKLATKYKMTVVTGPAGSTSAQIRKISPNGMMAGEYVMNGKTVCFLYKNGQRFDLTPTDKESSVESVTDDGTVCGYVEFGDDSLPFIATVNSFKELSLANGFTGGSAKGMDSEGNAVLNFYADNDEKSIKQKLDVQTNLTVAGADRVGIASVSSSGKMIGSARISGTWTPVLFNAGETSGTALSLVADNLYIRTLNNLGSFVGAEKVNGTGTAFVDINGVHTVLPSRPGSQYAYMLGINDGNVAVGIDQDIKSNATAWSATDGLIDLDTRIQPMPDTEFRQALSIDNHGVIVGSGRNQGKEVGIILTPITNP